jgi:hypothetical protein
MYCAPSNNSTLQNSCFTENQILKICKSYNSTCDKKSRIKTANRNINSIYKELKSKLNNIDEYLWIENNKNTKFLSNDEIQGIFVPKMPNEWCNNIQTWRNQTNNNNINAPWLSNFDIDKVIKQYYNKYHNFIYLGTYPIDFQQYNIFGCVSNLCGFNIDNILSKNKNCFGLVLNTDKHTQSGTHWISIFCNIRTRTFYFFNSANNKKNNIPPEVIKFAKDVEQQVFKLYNKKLEFKFNNNVIHQSSNSECGIYSIYFILSLLDADENNNNGREIFEQYFNNPQFKLQDSKMLKQRFKYYRPNNKCSINK